MLDRHPCKCVPVLRRRYPNFAVRQSENRRHFAWENEITLNKEPKASKKIVLPFISTVAPGETNTTKGSRSDAYGEYGKQAV